MTLQERLDMLNERYAAELEEIAANFKDKDLEEKIETVRRLNLASLDKMVKMWYNKEKEGVKIMNDLERIKYLLKRIRIKEMCEYTDIDYKRVRNFLSGAVKYLTQEEIDLIEIYVKDLVAGKLE